MKHAAIILALAALPHAGGARGADADPYQLPRNKLEVEPCKQAVFALHPGNIQEFKMLHQGEAFYLRYEVHEPNGREWAILCDGSTGKIIRVQELDNSPNPTQP